MNELYWGYRQLEGIPPCRIGKQSRVRIVAVRWIATARFVARVISRRWKRTLKNGGCDTTRIVGAGGVSIMNVPMRLPAQLGHVGMLRILPVPRKSSGFIASAFANRFWSFSVTACARTVAFRIGGHSILTIVWAAGIGIA